MKRLLACLALCASLSASAQVVYPYNPDANGDSVITSGDLLDFLPVFATTFTPEGIIIDGVPLDEWLVDLQTAVLSLQAELNTQNAIIDSLQNAVMTRDSVVDIALDIAWRGELAGANLSGANLYGANLIGADLAGANLAGANLPAADLWVANLSGANLTGANLSGINLLYSDLSFADLSGAELANADIYHANLTGANLTGADLYGADLGDANLTGANLTGANISYAAMICLYGCPSILPTGYICELDPDCYEPYRFRIVPD